MYFAKEEDFDERLRFTRGELVDILACLETCKQVLEKYHDNSLVDIERHFFENDLRLLCHKIKSYLEEE